MRPFAQPPRSLGALKLYPTCLTTLPQTMNDEITMANRAYWEQEAKDKGGFTVPWLDL